MTFRAKWRWAAAFALCTAWWAASAVAASTQEAEGGEIFGTGFETGDCISWDRLVTGCETDMQCPTQLRFFSVCSANSCIECVGDSDCLNNPTALGPTCSAGNRCGCASSTECAANPAGQTCDLGAGVCTCQSSTECVPPKECRPTPYLQGLTTCW